MNKKVWVILGIILIGLILKLSLNETRVELDNRDQITGQEIINQEQNLQKEDTLKKAIETNPNNDRAYLELGMFYSIQGRLEEAEKMYKKAIETNPNNEQAYAGLSTIYSRQGRLEEAEKILQKAEESYKKAIEINPNNEQTWLELGELYRRQGDTYYREGKVEEAEKILQKAEESYKKAIEINPKVSAKEFLGRIYITRGEYDKAEKLLNEVITEGSDVYGGCPYQALGILYSRLNNTKMALNSYKITADTELTAKQSQLDAAEYCFNAGDYYCALEYINRAIKLNNQADDYIMIKGFTLLMLKEFDEAEELFKELNNSKSESYAQAGFGHIAIIKKDYNTAEKYFSSIIESPDFKKNIRFESNTVVYDTNHTLYDMTYLGLGWVDANQNKHQDALKHYEEILKYNPNHLLGLISKGNSLSGLNRFDDALETFDKALELYPDNEYIIAEIGLIQYNKGDYVAAEASFRKALMNNNETYTCPYEGLGLVYYKQGKFEEAKKNLEKSIKINPDIEYKKYNALAKIYIQEGKIEQAKELLKKSIENYPYDKEAQQILNNL